MSKTKKDKEEIAGADAQPEANEELKEEKKSKKEKKHEAVLKGPLCKLVKDDAHEKHFKEYAALVCQPAYICKKCGRAAAEKESLCKPAGIKK